MIEDIKVTGYKSLMLDESIPSGYLNVLVGANASGKSSLLQALLLLRQSADKSGNVSAMHLSGPLYEGGTAQDVIHPAADHQLRIALTVDSVIADFTFRHNREDEGATPPRVLPAHAAQAITSNLFDRESGFAYLNAERIGPRVTYGLPPDDLHLGGLVGKHGEYTAAILARSKNGTIIEGWGDELLNGLAGGSERLDRKVILGELQDSGGRLDLVSNEMLSWIIPGARFDVEESTRTDSASLRFFRDWGATKTSVRATHIGFGLAYTLPIITAGLSLKQDGLLIVENPEAHLHPFSQSRIGVFLACLAGAGRQVFVETHSDHVVNGMRLAVRESLVPHADVFINFFSRDGDADRSTITQIRPKANGRLDKWPAGFFDQIENDLSRL